jgi:hypothetical protein
VKNDLIIGMASGYTWQDLQPFVLSLEQSGYTGRCVLIFGEGHKDDGGYAPGYNPGAYIARHYIHPVDIDKDKKALYAKLAEHGVEAHDIGTFEGHPIMSRHPSIADVIDAINPRYVLSTDTKDIVFQLDPTTWLEQHLGDKQICVVSEGITYAQNPGNAENCRAAYGEEIAESLKDEFVVNCGVLSGTAAAISQ